MSKERERVGGLDEDVQALRAELEAAKRREAALLIQLASSQGACAALLKRCEQEVVARLSDEAECAALRRAALGAPASQSMPDGQAREAQEEQDAPRGA